MTVAIVLKLLPGDLGAMGSLYEYIIGSSVQVFKSFHGPYEWRS